MFLRYHCYVERLYLIIYIHINRTWRSFNLLYSD